MGAATPGTPQPPIGMRMQQQPLPPPPPPAAPALPVHELENPDMQPPPTEKGRPMLPLARMYEATDLEEDLEEIMLVGGARYAKKREGVAIRLSAPGNTTYSLKRKGKKAKTSLKLTTERSS